MNQEKIGNFIRERRKAKNLTQKDLAEKLNVTDRSVSKWETGKNLPDFAIFEDLCKELDITINELLSGEKLQEENYHQKFESNIIKTINFKEKTQTKKFLITRVIKLFINIIFIYLLYRMFILYEITTILLNRNMNDSFPYKEKTGTITINNTIKGTSSFQNISYSVPNGFIEETDKNKVYFQSDDCKVYQKDTKSKREFSAELSICRRKDLEVSKIDIVKEEYADKGLFLFVDTKKLQEKYGLTDVFEYMRYVENNKNNYPDLITPLSEIKMDYIAKSYVSLISLNGLEFYYIEGGDLKGYQTITKSHLTKDQSKENYITTVILGDEVYSFEMLNNQEAYFNKENVKEILASVSNKS